jgi:hypothetical protein
MNALLAALEECAMLTQQELKKWQDEMFELSKQVIKKDGYHIPLVILATEKRLMQSGKPGALKIITADDLLKFKNMEEFEKNKRFVEEADMKEISDDTQTIFITVPLSYSSQERLHMIVEMAPKEKQEELKVLIDGFLRMGKDMEVDDPFLRVGNAILRVLHLHEKDLHAHLIMKAIKRTGAYAFIKIDEMWYKSSDAKIGKDLTEEDLKKERERIAKEIRENGLEEDEDAPEGLGVMLETTELSRLLFVSVNKEGGRKQQYQDPLLRSH